MWSQKDGELSAITKVKLRREMELTEKFPLHVVYAWMENSHAVVAKHYLQVTDAHFQMAAGRDNQVQNPMQCVNAPVCTELRAEIHDTNNTESGKVSQG